MAYFVESARKNDLLKDKHYMPALTGLRAVAAYMVCFHHFNPLPTFQHAGGWKQLAYGFFNEMHIGVSIFFVLSGFLICYRYYNSNIHINRRWFGYYMMNRVARIYPMYFLLTLVTFILIETNPIRYALLELYSNSPLNERVGIFVLNITMLKGFFNDYKFTGIAQGWSLTVEECFYLGAPFFMLAMRRSRWFLLVLVISTLLFGYGLVLVVGSAHIHGLFGDMQFMLNFTFFGRCVEFFMGMAFALYILRVQKYKSFVLPGSWYTWLGIIALVIYLFGLSALGEAAQDKTTFASIWLNNLLLPIVVIILLCGLLREQSWISYMLGTKMFDLLGKSSYVFYLIHTGVINIILKTYFIHNSVVQFIILNIISIILYKFIESPLHKLIKPNSLNVK